MHEGAIYNGVGSVRKKQQGTLMHSRLGSAGVNMARPEGIFPETWNGVKRRVQIPLLWP